MRTNIGGLLAGTSLLTLVGLAQLLPSDAHTASWPQWGGPNQDFQAHAANVATTWPATGPVKLWTRELGQGYAAIVVEGNRLYTTHRKGGRDAAVCLDTRTGDVVWERSFEPSPEIEHPQFGNGPRATPLIAGKQLFTVGAAGTLHALDKRDGAVRWSHELWGDELQGTYHGHGYSSSPVAYGDNVIVAVGGDVAGLVAFDRRSGKIRWKSPPYRNSFSSPRIMRLLDEDQLVVFMAKELVALDPVTGKLRWSYPHANQWMHNITMPLALDGDTVFLSSPQTGAKGLKLRREGDTFEIEELWSTRRVQFYHAAVIRDGDWVYGSTGVTSPAFMTAVNIRTGEIGWKKRGFAKANCVAADGKVVILDEDGKLAVATATPDELTVHAETQLLQHAAWTVPTIVGNVLYARDNGQIVAIQLN